MTDLKSLHWVDTQWAHMSLFIMESGLCCSKNLSLTTVIQIRVSDAKQRFPAVYRAVLRKNILLNKQYS